jgi:hypothetical protein
MHMKSPARKCCSFIITMYDVHRRCSGDIIRRSFRLPAIAPSDPKSWIYVPVGTCSKIVRGSINPKA